MRPRPKPSVYRPIFEDANGPGPWPCHDCRESVQPDELHIHHIDEDPWNNEPENLASMHDSCHKSLHKRGKPLTPEHRAAISAAEMGRIQSAETRARISAGSRGRPKCFPKYRCGECSMTSTTRGLQFHQASTNHTGKVPV